MTLHWQSMVNKNTISYLATLTLAFMVFTASAQDSPNNISLIQLCTDSFVGCGGNGTVEYYMEDLHSNTACQNLESDITFFTMITAQLWNVSLCDRHGTPFQQQFTSGGGYNISESLTAQRSVRFFFQ